MSDDVVLEYTVAAREGYSIDISYTVHNRSGSEIYLFTPLPRFDGEDWEPAPQRVYTFREGGGVIHLSKRLWQVPEDVEVYMPEVPFLTRVAEGERFSEELVLPLPLSMDRPYLDAEVGASAVEARAMIFSIGYLPASPELELEESPDGMLQVGYGSAIERQVLLLGERREVALLVRE